MLYMVGQAGGRHHGPLGHNHLILPNGPWCHGHDLPVPEPGPAPAGTARGFDGHEPWPEADAELAGLENAESGVSGA